MSLMTAAGDVAAGTSSNLASAGSRQEWLYSPAQINEWFLRQFVLRGDTDTEDLPAIISVLKVAAARFITHDADATGELTFKQVASALKAHGLDLSADAVKDKMVDNDDDSSGTLRYREFGNMMLREEGYLTEPMVDATEPILLHSGNLHLPEGCAYGTAKDLKRLIKSSGAGVIRKQQRGHLMVEAVLKQETLTLQVAEGANLPLGATHVTARLVQDATQGSASAAVASIRGTDRKDGVVGGKKSENPTFATSFAWDVNVAWITSARLEVSVLSGKTPLGTLTFALEDIQSSDEPTAGWFVLLDVAVPSSDGAFASRSLAPSHFRVSQLLQDRKSSRSSKRYSEMQQMVDVVPPTTLQDISFTKVLGTGSFGKVFLARDNATKQQFAIKAVSKASTLQQDAVESIMTERRILSFANANGNAFIPHLYV